MSFIVVQFLTGLASASSLFLAACGLSIIFGVTRIVNFAHGAFYMLGAYVAYTLAERWTGGMGFWGAILVASIAVAALGALVEIALLRRIYHAPELFQLLATFGLTLIVEDLVVLVWGPDDLVGPRAPGLKGAVDIFGLPFPTYDLLLIALGPLVLGGLWLLFRRTRWGVLIRAATQDREMVAALGVNQKWLFTSVFALGVFLAAFGGAVQLPREAVTNAIDLQVIVEVFVVVVIGGLGNVFGAFVAAVVVSELNAFGILVLPGISLILVFLVMAVVLVVRPWGLFGKAEAAVRQAGGATTKLWRPWTNPERLRLGAVALVVLAIPLFSGPYALAVASEIALAILYAASLQFMMSGGGLVSFGHAAYFGLGAYGAALLVKDFNLGMEGALLLGPLLGVFGATLFGWFCVRLSGIYFAMLTLAFAQIAWSVLFQSVDLTGGDNGILSIWPSAWAASPARFYLLTVTTVLVGLFVLRVILFAPFGHALRATRDSELRAESIGLDSRAIRWAAFVVAGGFAALAGALYAFLKGSVFPDSLAIPVSVDGLVMVLLGGIGTSWGAIAGAGVFKALSIWITSHTDHSKLVIGCLIILLVVLFPNGLVGSFELWRPRKKLQAAGEPA